MIINPVFIIGNPRSGTTLLRVILNAHPDLVIPPECGFAMWLYPQFKNRDVSQKEVLADFIVELKKTRKFETWQIDSQKLFLYLIEKPPKTYAELTHHIYNFYALTHNITPKRWGDKNNFYLNLIDEINEVFPEAQFIHIVRDGRDVAGSYIRLTKKQINSKYKPNLPDQIDKIAKEWVTNNNKIESSLQKIETDRKIRVRHEDIILDFKNTIKSITDFLGMPYKHEMEDFGAAEKAKEPDEFMQWKNKLYGRLDYSSVGIFKNDLQPDQISTFSNLAKEALARYGYEI